MIASRVIKSTSETWNLHLAGRRFWRGHGAHISGMVGFKLNGHESFIPAGAACATRPKVGPGTPYFEDASAEFGSALTRFDFEDTTSQQRSQDVAIVLSEARNRDARTLWHLLARVDDEQRVLVYDRLSRFVPPPATRH
jgi:hypothetical protein